MKKVIYLMIFVGAILTGCNPLEDINNEIDALPQSPNIGIFEYTLTEDDYAAFNLGFGSFDSEDQAKDSIPDLLSELYPLYGQGSSVLVNYNLFVGAAEGLSDYTGAMTYNLQNSDYASFGSDAFGFYPNENPEDFIPAILDAQIAAPVTDQLVLATFRQYTETPVVGLADVQAYDFTTGFNGWTIFDVFGNEGWTEESGYIQGNGFNGGQQVNEEWLISPEIDLTGESDLKLQINQAIRFATDLSLLKILVNTNWDGVTLDDTQWNEINFATAPAGNSDTFVLSEDYDFSAYDGQTINIAFKYTSTASDAARWRIESLAIKRTGVTGATNNLGEYYVYDGTEWETADNVYYLSSADYNSMGEGSGQPGAFDNFSSSTPASNYLGTFLNIKYPFAQEEDEIFIIYKYFSSNSGLGTRGQKYTYTNGMWLEHQSTIETSLQFGFDAGIWVPDNTIRYNVSTPEFDYIEANYATTVGFESAVSSMANFGNFDRRPSNAAYWSNEMLVTVFADLLDNVIAPTAEEEQKYLMIFDIYDGSSGVEELALIKIDGVWIEQE